MKINTLRQSPGTTVPSFPTSIVAPAAKTLGKLLDFWATAWPFSGMAFANLWTSGLTFHKRWLNMVDDSWRECRRHQKRFIHALPGWKTEIGRDLTAIRLKQEIAVSWCESSHRKDFGGFG
jgi:hypothetical protein